MTAEGAGGGRAHGGEGDAVGRRILVIAAVALALTALMTYLFGPVFVEDPVPVIVETD